MNCLKKVAPEGATFFVFCSAMQAEVTENWIATAQGRKPHTMQLPALDPYDKILFKVTDTSPSAPLEYWQYAILQDAHPR